MKFLRRINSILFQVHPLAAAAVTSVYSPVTKLDTYLNCTYILRYSLVVRISGFHPEGPGSTPGDGIFFSHQQTFFYSQLRC